MRLRSSLIFLALVLVLSTTMTSCIKNYTCTCVIKYSGYPGLPDSVINEYEISNDKSDAKSKCNKESGTFTNSGITTVETCTLY